MIEPREFLERHVTGPAPTDDHEDRLSDAGSEQRVADYQRMHDLFLLALLSAHPEPRAMRGQFRTLLAGLTASHARYAFDESFLLAVRRSALRLDRMLELVITAQEAGGRPPGLYIGDTTLSTASPQAS
jgi:hypothetical protein